MADGQDSHSGCRGGIAPGPAGNREEAPPEWKPIGLGNGPPQSPLTAPTNSVGFLTKRYGRTEIGLYRTLEKVDYSKPAAILKSDFGSPNVNAYVTMSCDVAFLPRAQRLKDEEIYQAFMFLRVTGPFLPKELASGHECAKRSITPLPKPDTAETWPNVRKRLLEHEMGHFAYTLKDLATFGVYEVDLNKANLTYQQFQDYMYQQRDLWNTQVLKQSRTGWDNEDVEKCNEVLRNLYIEIPIEHE
jgi:hypothetical protein